MQLCFKHKCISKSSDEISRTFHTVNKHYRFLLISCLYIILLLAHCSTCFLRIILRMFYFIIYVIIMSERIIFDKCKILQIYSIYEL